MKKRLKLAGRILTLLVLVFSVGMMIFTVVAVNTVGKNASVFGVKPYIVLSDSMQDTFLIGDMTFSRAVDTDTLEPGDIITFQSIDPVSYGEVVTHKLREITTYEEGKAFITYGTTTGRDDAYPVPVENVLGEYSFRIPKLGFFFQFLKSPSGYFLIILIPMLILIGSEAVRFAGLAKQYQKERREELADEKKALEAERLETQKIKEELEQLRAEILAEKEKNE